MTGKLKLYNTLSRKKEVFTPLKPPFVGMYVCGPTTYDYAHIGHARVAIVFDMLRRFFEYMGYDVVLISNITDVDDKIINKANEIGEDPIKMAHRYAREYLKDMDALRVRRANIIPKATRHIEEIILPLLSISATNSVASFIMRSLSGASKPPGITTIS